jgi:hypothetical protein
MMSHRWALSGLVALRIAATAITATSIVDAAAQPIAGADPATAIQAAAALSARIRAYHRGPGSWKGFTPPPPSYCPTMREGEAVLKELARIANKAILFRQTGLALRLQRAGDQLSDELDQEEEINNAAEIPYDIFPCPVATSSYPARANFLGAMERTIPVCRAKADALRLSFDARRVLMQQCLRLRY